MPFIRVRTDSRLAKLVYTKAKAKATSALGVCFKPRLGCIVGNATKRNVAYSVKHAARAGTLTFMHAYADNHSGRNAAKADLEEIAI